MLSYDVIKDHLIEKISENEIVKNLKKISFTFTQGRDKIQKIYESRAMVASYACFYLPTNAQKMNFFLERVSENILAEIKESIVVELGTGPGTYLLALMDTLGPELTTFFGIDHNPLMLEQAQKLQQELFPTADAYWREDIPSLPKDKKVTLIFGNSLNEMGSALAFRLIDRINPTSIIFIEPGTKQSFHETSKLRTILIKEKFNIIYPCQSSDECPIIKNKLDDWCHQVVRTSLDPSTLRLSQLVSLDRTVMPAIIHFYSREVVREDQSGLIMRLLKSVKHAFFWEVCTLVDGELRLQEIEVPKKLFTKSELKALSKMSTGFNIEFSVDKVLGDGTIRAGKVVLK
ncbi:small ribosomal subunit Rsm22 family protein [Bacteriovorax sp. Seq25_V]|uniref:small ribosomal subunit Rsm22 family protein n=1 Tax=Bacteriovorax sp. Seq25_V TaxID=1201288 RepID=UPI00038A2488|nr:small ribosomal subunit Rsm22 family protein [Bacteriovorax sp. Seq25_V]EQC46677.1 hypothetical protein M900_2357 [Bacteriovorax sp. Seq25_V]